MREDWVEVELGEVAKSIQYGYTESSSNKPIGPKFLRITDIQDNNVDWSNVPYCKISNEKLENYLLKKGDLLFARTGATVGKSFLIRNEIPESVFASYLIRVRVNSMVLDECFLSHFFYSPFYWQQITEGQVGIGQPNVNGTKLGKLKISIAPLPIQRAIVTKLENLFASLDKGIADLQTAQAQLKVYRQAVLKKAFEGEFTKEWREKNPYSLNKFLNEIKKEKSEAIKSKLISKDDYFPEFSEKDLVYSMPENWICLPWKTLTSNNRYAMKRGPFGSTLKKEFFVDKGYVVYEQGHAINDEPYRHRYFITPKKYEEMKAFSVKGGDMIISCSGVTLGRICLLPNDADFGIINQALLKIDMDEKIMLKNYFVMLFRSETFQRLIFGKSLGTAMPNMVGMPELKQIPIPVPSFNEQKQIIREIESRLSVCDKVEQSISESLEQAKALRQSILKKAFEGKLLIDNEIAQCKQAADYEPASVLLERIKNEKKNGK